MGREEEGYPVIAAVDELGGRRAEGCSNRGGEGIKGHFIFFIF